MIDFGPFLLTIKLAAITTCILFVIAVPFCYWLSNSTLRYKFILETVISLPLVLPPSVLGFYLLLALSPQNFIGQFLKDYFDVSMVFSFHGLILASVFYSLPFMVNPIYAGFSNLPSYLKEASYSLGKSRFQTLIRVLLPNIRTSLITGIVMAFAHTIGEFGVVLMIGGSIPEETRVVSIVIYDEVQAMNYENANVYSAVLLIFSFLILLPLYSMNANSKKLNPL